MFFLSVIEHTLQLPPHLLGLTKEKALRQELENLFLDKIIANLGLCVSVYDVHSISGGFIFPGDGAPTYTVECRLVMFRPFVGEIIDARLKEFNKDGLRLSMGFFDDIYIPSHLLPHPSRFAPDPENGNHFRWVREYGAANDKQENAEASGTTYSIDEIGEGSLDNDGCFGSWRKKWQHLCFSISASISCMPKSITSDYALAKQKSTRRSLSNSRISVSLSLWNSQRPVTSNQRFVV